MNWFSQCFLTYCLCGRLLKLKSVKAKLLISFHITDIKYSMHPYYPEIRNKQRTRLLLTFVVLFLPFVLPLVSMIAFENWILCAVVAIVSVCISVKLYRLINTQLLIKCPQCASGVLIENYANSPRGTDKNVEHTCNTCKAFFVDARLQSKT
jgi:uncharacterized membrane protein (DUF485 family)